MFAVTPFITIYLRTEFVLLLQTTTGCFESTLLTRVGVGLKAALQEL